MLVLSVCLLLTPVLGAVVSPPDPEQIKQDVKEKKVVEEEVKAGDTGVRKPRQDIPWAASQAREAASPPEESRTHWGSGFPTFGGGHHQQPQVTFNLQAPWSSGPSYGGWVGGLPSQGGFFPRPTSGVGCGGQTVQIQDTHFPTQQVPQTYTASVPFIAGYRLTPVIGQKQIVLNDLYGGAAAGGLAAGCGYWQNLYGHARQANKQSAPEDILWPDIKSTSGVQAGPENTIWVNTKSASDIQARPETWPSGVVKVSPEEILRPFEEARYFQPPLELEHGLAAPHEYQARIEDMQHHIEHMQSLRDSTSDDDNLIAS